MRICFIFILFISCIATFAYAEEKPFIYDDSGMNDPFVPLISKEGKFITGSGVIRSINDVVLEGIVYDPAGESVAILNGLILRENDQVGKITVKKINRDTVILTAAGKDHQFRLKE